MTAFVSVTHRVSQNLCFWSQGNIIVSNNYFPSTYWSALDTPVLQTNIWLSKQIYILKILQPLGSLSKVLSWLENTFWSTDLSQMSGKKKQTKKTKKVFFWRYFLSSYWYVRSVISVLLAFILLSSRAWRTLLVYTSVTPCFMHNSRSRKSTGFVPKHGKKTCKGTD